VPSGTATLLPLVSTHAPLAQTRPFLLQSFATPVPHKRPSSVADGTPKVLTGRQTIVP
jgi:hypothetical protein